jgi:lactobin A/cerein 7B family class IIb bacteriocin
MVLACVPNKLRDTVAVPNLWSMKMRELTETEIDSVNGGILPLIGFGLALAGKAFSSAGVFGWAVNSAGLILASYSLGDYMRSRRL